MTSGIETIPIVDIAIEMAWRRPLNGAHLAVLADAPDLPPITVSNDLRLVDGWHRLEVARARGRDAIRVRRLAPGLTDLELQATAVSANVRHGLALTSAERTEAVIALLVAGCDWSDRRIAATCGVSKNRVPAIRAMVAARNPAPSGVPQGSSGVPWGHPGGHRVGIDGRRYPVRSAERVALRRLGWLGRFLRWLREVVSQR